MMKTKSEKREYWQSHNRAYEESGLTMAGYCMKAEINSHTMQYYREKFQKENREQMAAGQQSVASRFVKVRPVAPQPKELGVEFQNQVVARVQLGRGTVLECLRWPEAEWLLKLVEVRG